MESPLDSSHKRRRESGCVVERTPRKKNPCEAARRVAYSLSKLGDVAVGLDTQVSELENILRRAIKHGGSTSVLLVGARGSGKSLALRLALRRTPLKCIYVKGALFADDAAALQEITRQLQPRQILSNIGGRSFAGNMRFVGEALRLGSIEGKPTLLVLDDFEIFARGKQTLLYSLLDAAQSMHAAIVVLGMSADLTIMCKLEKRVESRFSQRQIFFPGPTLSAVHHILKRSLSLQEEPREEALEEKEKEEYDGKSQGTQTDKAVSAYNRAVASALESPRIHAKLERSVMCGRPFRFFRGIVSDAAASIATEIGDKNPEAGFEEIKWDVQHLTSVLERLLLEAIELQTPDLHTQSIIDCSTLQLVLLACISRLEHRDVLSYGFDVVWSEYQQYLRLHPTSLERFSRGAAVQGFQSLITRGIIVSSDGKTLTRTGVENLQVRLAIDADIIVNVVNSEDVRCSTTLHRWVTKWNHGLR